MKGYICAILLLICGEMAYSATQVRASRELRPSGSCLFLGYEEVSVGKHTMFPCKELVCDTDGQITMSSCPSMACNFGEEVTGIIPERQGKPYPDCCAQLICKSRPISVVI
ncbi:uncharacterized protein [Temnothorax longispinosus]|uniref:uncharacterized protein n=1 Tax=Temnothorax longispinosus TaxID=300112 RepID=UPI003A98E997